MLLLYWCKLAIDCNVAVNRNQGIAASWFNQATSGLGFLIDIRPLDQFIFVVWFTFDLASVKVGAVDQRWFVASANPASGQSVGMAGKTHGSVFYLKLR
jgi:hypothetical protein